MIKLPARPTVVYHQSRLVGWDRGLSRVVCRGRNLSFAEKEEETRDACGARCARAWPVTLPALAAVGYGAQAHLPRLFAQRSYVLESLNCKERTPSDLMTCRSPSFSIILQGRSHTAFSLALEACKVSMMQRSAHWPYPVRHSNCLGLSMFRFPTSTRTVELRAGFTD